MTPIFIANNCINGFIDWILHREHLHPWVFCAICPKDVIKFFCEIDTISHQNFTLHPYCEWKYYNINPEIIWKNINGVEQEKSIVLRYDNGIELLYGHYSIDESDKFINTYNRRLKRFLSIKNKKIIFTLQTYNYETDKHYMDFLKLSNEKILFDNKHNYHLINKIDNLQYFTHNSFHDVLKYNLKTRKTWGAFNNYILKTYSYNV